MSELLQTASSTSLPLHKIKCESMRRLFSFKGHIHSLSVQWICFMQLHKCSVPDRWFEETHQMTLSLKPAQMSQKRNTQVSDPSTNDHSSLFHWQRFTRVGHALDVLTQRHRAQHWQPVWTQADRPFAPQPHENDSDHTALSANQGWLLDRNFYRQFKWTTCYGLSHSSQIFSWLKM